MDTPLFLVFCVNKQQKRVLFQKTRLCKIIFENLIEFVIASLSFQIRGLRRLFPLGCSLLRMLSAYTGSFSYLHLFSILITPPKVLLTSSLWYFACCLLYYHYYSIDVSSKATYIPEFFQSVFFLSA